MRPIRYVRGIALAALVACSTVVADGLRCAHCDEPIHGQYFTFQDKAYLPGHFLCSHCNTALGERFVTHDGLQLHDSCYTRYFAVHCHVCREPIDGSYVYTPWGDTLHSEHQQELARCAHCDRFIAETLTGGGTDYRDGRRVCNQCEATAIHDEVSARPALDSAVARLKRLGVTIEHSFTIHLVDRDEMRRRAREPGRDAFGFADYREKRSLFGLVKARTIDIYALSGLPAQLLHAVFVHELMHIWQYSTGRFNNDDALRDGSCEYAAYRALEESADPEAQLWLATMWRNEDPIYGDGLRKVAAFADSAGIAAWLDYLATHDEPPW